MLNKNIDEYISMKSSANIAILEAKRIAKRLLNHWKHKFEVAENEDQFSIFMPKATIVLTAQSDQLLVQIITDDADNTNLENVVLDHLNRMAQQEFQANWTHTA